MLNAALECVRRGWYVFPCWPKSKKPMTKRGFLDATNDPGQVRAWWAGDGGCGGANVAIATGPSGLCVVDIDHGINGLPELYAWMDAHGLPLTYAVRTGRRHEFGVQLYYSGTGLKSTGWQCDGLEGDIRCATGYVMAAGSVHPSGHQYATVFGYMVPTPTPEFVRTLTTKASDPSTAPLVDDETADGWKTWLLEYMDFNRVVPRGYEKRAPNGWWLGIECPWVNEHQSGPGAESSTVLGILDGKIAFECSHGTCKAAGRGTAEFTRMYPSGPEPGADPIVTIGLPKPKAAWQSLFHSQAEVEDCPPPTFLIKDFLAHQAICAIAAPVGQRKSLIALNIAHSLCTGEPLFGFLSVENRPSRVLYLCPEMGLISLASRVTAIGLTPYIGTTLFVRSMNLGNLNLKDLPDDALDGSVLIVDTAIRFMSGDENSSKDMQAFSEVLFDTQRRQGPSGAIIVLYHSPKATKDASELTLENCLRGSGELGAAVTDAHGTRLQDPEKRYDSPSFIRHIKDRDYEGVQDFEVIGDRATGMLRRIGEVKAVLSVPNKGNKSNRDGLDGAARQFIKEHMDLTVRKTVDALAELGIKRSTGWVGQEKSEIKGNGSKLSEG